MKSRLLLSIIAALITFPAFATKPLDPPHVPKQDPVATADAEATAAAQASASAAAVAGSSSGGNTLTSAVDFEDRLQAPSSFAPSIAPSAPCYYGSSLAVSIPGGSAGGGRAKKDEACENRENIRLAYLMGLTVEADYLFCSSIGKEIPNCGKRPVLPQQPATVLPSNPVYVTKEELVEHEQRIVEGLAAK